MLRVGLLCCACAAAVACGGGRTASPAPQALPRGARVVAVTDSLLAAGGCDTLRFGRLRSGEIARKRLWIENRTQRAVALLSYERTCGCTTLGFDSEPLPPGALREVEVTFDSRGEQGWQLKLVELRLAGAARNLRLVVEAEVE
ncbi:DUF1573 domain-containing protein [uncultured Alistipes sp.]|uniref:DUF1573 domain-containing protein n=1 Tax=uncultured Alistipes sp. TaxID=538949 RepID=UPI00261179BD|nr:DUF1573 domain-containing protein [uncultured Alistipes sp.]